MKRWDQGSSQRSCCTTKLICLSTQHEKRTGTSERRMGGSSSDTPWGRDDQQLNEGWHAAIRVRLTVTRVQRDAWRASRDAQGQNSLHRHVHGAHVERLEHGLLHALPVRTSFSEQDGIFSGATLSSSAITMAVVRLAAKRDKIAWIATFMAGTLIVSNMISRKVLERRQDRSSDPHQIPSHRWSEEFWHSKHLRSSLVKGSRPRWQHAAVSWYFDTQSAVELDLENVRDVVGQPASHLGSVRFHGERQRLRDAS